LLSIESELQRRRRRGYYRHLGPVAAPVFSKHLRSVDIPEGVALVLECHVTGTPLPSISWYHDSQPVSGDDSSVGVAGGTSSVVIGQLRPEHSGEYVCRATNVAGQSATSAAIRVVRKYQR